MAKVCSTLVLNAACTYIRDNATAVAICNSSFTSASTHASDMTTSGHMLAFTTLTTGASTSWTIAAGDVSGLKLTMTSQGGVAVAATGVADKVVLYNASTFIYITTCATQVLGSTANTVTIPTFDIEWREAT